MRRKATVFLAAITLIALLLTFFPVSYTEAEADTIAEVDAEIAECNSILNALIAERADISNKINEIGSSAANASKQIELCIQQKELIQAEINLMDETIAQYDLKSGEVAGKMGMLQLEMESVYEMYSDVLLYTYMNGGTSNFELLFSSENLSDFLTNLENSKYIIEYNNQLLSQLKEMQSDMNAVQQDYEKSKENIQEYVDRQTEAKNALIAKEQELNNLASQLGLNIEELNDKYANVNAKINDINKRISTLKKKRQDILDSMSDYLFPLPAGTNFVFTSPFGIRVDPISGKRGSMHRGVDLACARGTKILATKSGTVTTSGWAGSNSYGNYVIIYHGNGMSSLYAHCDELLVKAGQTVTRGQVIAKVGSTGYSTGNHLHFSIMENGVFVNPAKYLPKGYLS